MTYNGHPITREAVYWTVLHELARLGFGDPR